MDAEKITLWALIVAIALATSIGFVGVFAS